jgi:hypothetical protein
MAIAHIASSPGANNGAGTGNMAGITINTGATSTTFKYTATGVGNVVLIWVTMVPQSASPTTCTLSATGWTFSQIGGVVNGGASAGVGAMFSAVVPNTSQATITMTWNQPTTNFFNDLIDEFSGADTTTVSAGTNSATGSGTPTVSVTPTVNNCAIWVACNDSVTAVGTIGGTAATKGGDDGFSDWSEYRLLSGGSGVAQSCAFTGSGSYCIGAVAIRPAGTIYTQFLSARMCEFNMQQLA